MSLDAEPGHHRPRWVTVTVVVAVLVMVLLVVLWALGGSHGPGRHLSSPAAEAAPGVLGPVGG